MKKCKNCQSEIDKKARECPYCHKKQKKPIWLRILRIIFLIMLVRVVIENILMYHRPNSRMSLCSQAFNCTETDENGMVTCNYCIEPEDGEGELDCTQTVKCESFNRSEELD